MPFPPTSAAPPRRRPGGSWFVVGAVLCAAAVVFTVAVVALTGRSYSHVQATVASDGRPVTVQVDPGTTYLVRQEADGPEERCTFLDGDGTNLTPGGLYPDALLSPTFRHSTDGEGWVGEGYLLPTTSPLTVTCSFDGGSVQIGEKPRVGAFVGGPAGVVLVLLLLGGGGTAILVTTGILRAVRKPDPDRARETDAGSAGN